jgi:coproporphyrinogen III oxidase
MLFSPHPARQYIVQFLLNLREEIISTFEQLEPSHCKFKKESWNYEQGSGGGEMAVLRGDVFEKAAVNWSGLEGAQFPMSDGKGPFFATGVSLITHMKNPHVPTVHMNVRFMETQEGFWFGGGYDMTPMGISYQEDTHFFHHVAKNALDPFGLQLYESFSRKAQEYYYIPHRQKERGIGGLFFDHYNTGHFERDLAVWKAVGHSFLEAVMPIYRKRVATPYTSEEKEKQLEYRGHYAEFNLVYDRGTKFGFQSGGNARAILCSMPPLAKW